MRFGHLIQADLNGIYMPEAMQQQRNSVNQAMHNINDAKRKSAAAAMLMV